VFWFLFIELYIDFYNITCTCSSLYTVLWQLRCF